MRAITITGHGGNEVVAIGERPVPVRRRGEVLVKVHGSGLNRVDLYMRDSGAGITHRLPQIMGLDAAGTVVDLDDEERCLSSGQAVVIHPGIGCGRCEFCLRGEHVLCTRMQFLGEHRDGTLADYVCVPAGNVFPMPQALDFIEAAALGVAPVTAWRMVFTKAQLRPWETVLIFGIGGAVSLSALQFAKVIGARVIVTSRDPAKLARAVELGADATIDGAKEDIATRTLELSGGRGVDVVIENVGEAVWPSALKSLVRGGRIVTCGATSGDRPSADLRRLFIRQLQVFGSTHGTFAEFRDLLALCERGLFRPVIDSRLGFVDVHAGLDRLEAGRQFGKIGIEIAGTSHHA
ncbi:zinc-binding dehydrogenase [Rhodovastum atsumiense]|uniref:Zinc-binding dehydrogenase n=2 Tax=Rhodovastum atsumiense TaxID=504468 RepID=A0A5M6J3F4_9PROT|nr:zinc-binding dehydrogenase [Rhodovastum atsumiense]